MKQPKDDIKNLEHKGYLITYANDFVKSICTKDRNLTVDLSHIWTYNHFHSHIYHLYDFRDYQIIVRDRIIELCELAKDIYDIDGELYCYISSHIFGVLEPYSKVLRNFHLDENALKFWKYILTVIKKWEAENESNEIHKGTIYGFIAEINMNRGDYEMAFTNLYRAVREDFHIEKHIPDYARNAPGYKIITLRPTRDHWMWGYVQQIRDELSLDIQDFNRVFKKYAPFKIEDFDLLFIDNDFFDKDEIYRNLKITVSYYIWATYYYSWKIDRTEKSSIFDNLNGLPKLFGMCATIETLVYELIEKKERLIDKTDLLYRTIGGTQDYRNILHPKVNRKDEFIDSLLTELLDYNKHIFAGIPIDEVDRCILIYTLIRNFTAHNVKSIEVIGNNFFNIAQSLLFILLVFLIELKKENKIE